MSLTSDLILQYLFEIYNYQIRFKELLKIQCHHFMLYQTNTIEEL